MSTLESRLPLVSPAPREVATEPPTEDAALAAALKRGEAQAATALFDRHGQRIERLLRHLVGFDQEVADLLHESFTRALSRIHTLKRNGSLRAWLTSIAVRVAKEHLRLVARRRSQRPLDEDAMPDLGGVSPERRALLNATHRVIASLPERERVPFSLRFIAGLPLAETAEACGVSLATVKRRLRKARERFISRGQREPALRSWLAEEGR